MSKWYRPIENGIMTLPEVAVGSNNYLMYLNGKYQVFPVSMYLPMGWWIGVGAWLDMPMGKYETPTFLGKNTDWVSDDQRGRWRRFSTAPLHAEPDDVVMVYYDNPDQEVYFMKVREANEKFADKNDVWWFAERVMPFGKLLETPA